MKEQYPTVAIIALNTRCNKFIEEAYLEGRLGVRVKKVQGRYDGVDEISYIVPMPPSPCPEFKAKLVQIARDFEQECFFVLLPPDAHGRRRCISFHKDDFHHAHQEGYFVPCTQSQAYKSNGFTFDASTGQHYILEVN